MDKDLMKTAHTQLVSKIGNTFRGKKEVDLLFKLSEDRLSVLAINDTSDNSIIIASRPIFNFVYWQPGPSCDAALFAMVDQICSQHVDETRGSGADIGPRDLKIIKLFQDAFRKARF